jgi:hypothetical protein
MLRRVVLAVALLANLAPAQADDIRQIAIAPGRYADAREALVDAIEGEGLIPAPPSRFGDMLARTGPALDQPAPIYAEAEVLHFCSARIAWQLARETRSTSPNARWRWPSSHCPASRPPCIWPGAAQWATASAAGPPTNSSNALPATPPTMPAAAACSTESALRASSFRPKPAQAV